MMREAYEGGILVGWFGQMRNAAGEPMRVFIPRRDEDIAADRAKARRK